MSDDRLTLLADNLSSARAAGTTPALSDAEWLAIIAALRATARLEQASAAAADLHRLAAAASSLDPVAEAMYEREIGTVRTRDDDGGQP